MEKKQVIEYLDRHKCSAGTLSPKQLVVPVVRARAALGKAYAAGVKAGRMESKMQGYD